LGGDGHRENDGMIVSVAGRLGPERHSTA
jgi:hypothetical protein